MQSWQKVTDNRESELHSIVRKYILRAFVVLAANMLSLQRNSYGAVRSNVFVCNFYLTQKIQCTLFPYPIYTYIYTHMCVCVRARVQERFKQ